MENHFFSDPIPIVIGGDGNSANDDTDNDYLNERCNVSSALPSWKVIVYRRSTNSTNNNMQETPDSTNDTNCNNTNSIPVGVLYVNNETLPPRMSKGKHKKVVWKLPDSTSIIPKFGILEQNRLWELYKEQKKESRRRQKQQEKQNDTTSNNDDSHNDTNSQQQPSDTIHPEFENNTTNHKTTIASSTTTTLPPVPPGFTTTDSGGATTTMTAAAIPAPPPCPQAKMATTTSASSPSYASKLFQKRKQQKQKQQTKNGINEETVVPVVDTTPKTPTNPPPGFENSNHSSSNNNEFEQQQQQQPPNAFEMECTNNHPIHNAQNVQTDTVEPVHYPIQQPPQSDYYQKCFEIPPSADRSFQNNYDIIGTVVASTFANAILPSASHNNNVSLLEDNWLRYYYYTNNSNGTHDKQQHEERTATCTAAAAKSTLLIGNATYVCNTPKERIVQWKSLTQTNSLWELHGCTTQPVIHINMPSRSSSSLQQLQQQHHQILIVLTGKTMQPQTGWFSYTLTLLLSQLPSCNSYDNGFAPQDATRTNLYDNKYVIVNDILTLSSLVV